MTAFHLESEFCEIWANTDMKLAFWGKHIELMLKSITIIRLVNKDLGVDERYELNFPKSNVNNLLFGKVMELNHWGDMYCTNLDNGDSLKTKVTGTTGLFLKAKDKAKVQGFAYRNGSNKAEYRLTGSWLDKLEMEKHQPDSDT